MTVFWTVFGSVLIISIVLITYFIRQLNKSKHWDLGKALAEPLKDGTNIARDNDNNPIYVSSSSRLIALMGLSVILVMNLGFAAAIYWSLIVNNTMPDLSKIGWYLFGQASIFAPYIANQARSAFNK